MVSVTDTYVPVQPQAAQPETAGSIPAQQAAFKPSPALAALVRLRTQRLPTYYGLRTIRWRRLSAKDLITVLDILNEAEHVSDEALDDWYDLVKGFAQNAEGRFT